MGLHQPQLAISIKIKFSIFFLLVKKILLIKNEKYYVYKIFTIHLQQYSIKKQCSLLSYKYVMNLINRILHLYLFGENIAASNTIHNILLFPLMTCLKPPCLFKN